MDDPMKNNGALRELESDPASRKRFLKMVGAGGAGALALLVAACGDDDSSNSGSNTGGNANSGSTGASNGADPGIAQFGAGDVGIAKYALTLEYLEADFYTQASKLGLKGEYKALAKDFGANEQAHVDALIATIKKLGGKPVKSPQFAFGMKSQTDFEKLAVTLEDTGVSAYNGAAPMIESGEVLAAAGGIVQVEARHAAALRFLAGMDPTKGPFDQPLEKAAVLKAVKPLIKA
jgi:rubrerythrin